MQPDALRRLLLETDYDKNEIDFLYSSFKYGFDLGYEGSISTQRYAPNLKLRIGTEITLWNKVMKEVKERRYAGPFSQPPFKNFVQSPIGLVPKGNGTDTRLIFHLSYPKTGDSINSGTPKWKTKVKYKDFSLAIRRCVEEGRFCKIGKSDMQSAFRILGLSRNCWHLLVIMAVSLADGKKYYFFDKSLPFGSGISCAHFTRVSDAIAHIVRVKCDGKVNVNYLDDYLFIAFLRRECNRQIQMFLDMCSTICFPVSIEKTFWGTTLLTFLGLLIDTAQQIVAIPADKVLRATELIQEIVSKRKVTVRMLQKVCGFLNFLCRCVVPGRAFTRRLYAHYSPLMKPHYHVRVNAEMRNDLLVWQEFLKNPSVYCRPFIDYSVVLTAEQMEWFTDASGKIGVGGMLQPNWFQLRWSPDFLKKCKPSIAYQELYAVTISVVLWARKFRNRRICLYCDNDSTCKMINKSSSNCKNCMVLIRRITYESMTHNVRIFAKWIKTDSNNFADALSRFQMKHFWRDVEKYNKIVNDLPDVIPEELDPVENIWLK